MRFPDESGRSLGEVVARAPSGAVLDLAPGIYLGPLVFRRGMILRGSGDLTRIQVRPGAGSVVRVETEERVRLESVLIEGGRAEAGGGLAMNGGELSLFNVQIRDCSATRSGGALHVANGRVHAERLRIHGVKATKGGALHVSGVSSDLTIVDAEIRQTEAEQGGAAVVADGAQLQLEAVSVFRARASRREGGQTLWVDDRGTKVTLQRVRFGDAPVGQPIVNAGAKARILVEGCDLPKLVRDTPGLELVGETLWR